MISRLQQENVHAAGDARELKILWVKIGGLWPANTGGRIRSFNIISQLSRRHQVTVLTSQPPGENCEELIRQLPHCVRIDCYPATPAKVSSVGFVLALLQSWFTRLPVDLWKSQVTELKNEVADLLKHGEFDLCIADFLVAIPNVPLNGSVPIVYFSHNVEYMIWKRLCENERSWIRRLLLAIEWRKLKRYEKMACQYADLTIAVSPEDRDLLVANSPEAKCCAIPTGVDIDYFSQMQQRVIPGELVFTGSMDWHPNEDAMLFFMESILPFIRRDYPEVSLTVVGRNPSLHLTREAFKAKVSVTGTVTDIRPYVDVASIYIVPLRIGGGTRIKIFEALAMGKAVISTTVGAEGLPLIPDEHFICVDDPLEFARAVIALLRDPERRNKLGAAGRELVATHYSWEQVTNEFEICCNKVVRQSLSGSAVPATERLETDSIT